MTLRSLRLWWGLSLSLTLCSSTWGDNPAVIYLKWQEELTPRQQGAYWTTGAPQLDELLRTLPPERLQKAAPFQLHSDPVGLRRVLRLEVADAQRAAQLVAKLQRLNGAIYAEIAAERRIDSLPVKGFERGSDEVPGDPLYGEQWCFEVMDAPAAWDVTHGSSDVVVAVVDNGVDWAHPDLSAAIWSNPNEIAGNGVDDDGNGFIDDVRGWDFQDNDNDPQPEISLGSDEPDPHGTHVAGLIGAQMNNRRGVVGMASGCKVMPLRVGAGTSIYLGSDGIIYAAHNGADVINLSWGGSVSLSFERDVITDAVAQGCVVVAAAGNEGNITPHYPAAFSNVVAVAATGADDRLASFSNYGTWISLCAPGTQILSLYPAGYGISLGTSMSCPLVSGVAALVKSVQPTWSVDQITQRLLLSADDITHLNSPQAGFIGAGRVNAYRAVGEAAPVMQILDLSLTDVGDADGRLDPGESALLHLKLHNAGSATWDVHLTLSCNDPAITVTQPLWNVGQIPASSTITGTSIFQITLASWAQANREITLDFAVTTENFYAQSLSAALRVDPTYSDHDTGNVALTITEFGALGFYDYPESSKRGSGFRFPQKGLSALQHGSLVAGVAFDRVSDGCYGNLTETRFDWEVVSGGELAFFPGTEADQEGWAVYRDTAPPANEQVGLQVSQHSYAYANAPNNDFVIISYTLQNESSAVLNDLYVGLFLDWNLLTDPNLYLNSAAWDATSESGYVYDPQTTPLIERYYGSCLLSSAPVGYRVINLANDIPFEGFSDSLKYAFMSSGFAQTFNSTPADVATLLTAGLFSLAIGASEQVAFAILAGEDLSDLRTNASAARAIWNNIVASSAPPPANGELFQIASAFPQPCNGDLNLKFYLPGAGNVRFDIVDLLGRSVAVHSGYYQQAGTHRIVLPQWSGSSGVYFITGDTEYGRAATRIVWVK